MMRKFKDNLILKLVFAIICGILLGQLAFIPKSFYIALATFTSMFKEFLNFVIPLMIIAFVVKGIAELKQDAGKLLAVTTGLAYLSSVLAGIFAYIININLFPLFITSKIVDQVKETENIIEPAFNLTITPIMDVTSAVVFAFMIGLGISWLRQDNKGQELFNLFNDFEIIVRKVLSGFIIPLLPFYIFGNFTNLSYSGSVFYILSIFWKVFIIVLILHLIYLSLLFFIASAVGKQNFFDLIKHQVPAYLTAVGTQSSAATIPVNLDSAEMNNVSEEIRNFVVPLCATIHLAGSMITIISCSIACLLIYDIPFTFATLISFIFILAVTMVAAPGAPGGAIMSALPFLPMVGITTEAMQQLMISLYLTQDSFGTAANVSGDNAIAILVDTLFSNKE